MPLSGNATGYCGGKNAERAKVRLHSSNQVFAENAPARPPACPLYTRKRTSSHPPRMSANSHYRTSRCPLREPSKTSNSDFCIAEGSGTLVADHAAGKTGQDWCECRQTGAVRDLPIGGSGGGEGLVPENPAAHRWAAAHPFAAMTAARPDASSLPNRTGLCRAARSAPSRGKMVTGASYSSPNQPNRERTTAYRASAGPDLQPDGRRATAVGDWQESSGESRLRLAAFCGSTRRTCRESECDL